MYHILYEQFQDLIGNKNFKISNINHIKNLNNDKIILLTSLGSITYEELDKIQKRLNINNKILLGIILVNL